MINNNINFINEITFKICTCCNINKPLDSNNYNKDKQKSFGFCSICKECDKLKHKKHEKSANYKALRAATYRRNIEWHKKYRKKIQPIRNETEKTKSKTDVSFALNRRMRCLVWQGLRRNKNNRKWSELVGYSINDLRVHLEKQFKDGMTWERFLSGEIHIDHKQPRASFQFKSHGDVAFKKCWSLENLQPLWALDNIKKGKNVY
jgi:hypothetical protein